VRRLVLELLLAEAPEADLSPEKMIFAFSVEDVSGLVERWWE